jgi:hypothetical protein
MEPRSTEIAPSRSRAFTTSARAWVARSWQRGAVALLVAVLSWPSVVPAALPSLDVSWRIALQLAVPTRMSFGPDLLFTNGPLGFALYPQMFYTGPGTLALLTFGLIWIAFALSSVVVLARALPLPAAGALALGVLVLVSRVAPDSPTVVIALSVLLLLTDALVRGKFSWPWRTALVLGLLPALVILMKSDSGLSILAMVGIACTAGGTIKRGARGGLENAAAVAAGFVVGVPILWILSRQSLGDLPTWIGGSWQLVRGYSAAMGNESQSAEWQYAAAVLLVATLLAFVWTARSSPRPLRIAVTLVLAAGLYPLFRSGFTRHEGRGPIFFVAFVVVPLAFITVWSRRDVFLVLLAGARVVVSHDRRRPRFRHPPRELRKHGRADHLRQPAVRMDRRATDGLHPGL